MWNRLLVCPRITYLSGKECTLDECYDVHGMKDQLCALNVWAPHEIMVLVDGKQVRDDDPAPQTAYVAWEESEESDDNVWRADLKHLADFGNQAGANRCAAKSLSLNKELAKRDFVCSSIKGNLRIVEAYITAGLDKEDFGDALFRSTSRGHLHIVNALLSANANVNSPPPHGCGNYALHESCLRGYIDIAKVLIAAHADINAKNAQNFTPLNICVRRRQYNIASVLRDAEAQVKKV